ncbi:hypothetical protein ABGB17_05105 [Sphaerisporangium sp. B11E5]|uniref:hypothetical protein n=1 Tax=Sphaerisporangium sp. B11E5 TaxID=3153563 RepID=UPI00325F2850
MAAPDPVDPALAAGLGPDSADTLRRWAQQKLLRFELERWFANGRSGARVALVRATHRTKGTVKLVLKLVTPSGDDFSETEYARNHRALEEAPHVWRSRLPSTVHDPLPVVMQHADRRYPWIFFQTLATGRLDDYNTLTALLDAVLRPSETRPGIAACDADMFAAVCRRVVSGVLAEWAVFPTRDEGPAEPVAAFLRRHFGTRLTPPPSLNDGAMWTFPAEPEPLPNPLRLLRDDSLTAGVRVPVLLGRTHGDLNSENVLVQVNPVDPGKFALIDLARYESRGPLTRDPVYLLLYLIGQSMNDLSSIQRSALIDALVTHAGDGHARLPGWLGKLIDGIRAPALEWIEPTGYRGDWQRQSLLSTVACALLFLDHPSVRSQDREWFLRLAARAAHSFLTSADITPRGDHVPAPVTGPQEPKIGTARSWPSRLSRGSLALVTTTVVLASGGILSYVNSRGGDHGDGQTSKASSAGPATSSAATAAPAITKPQQNARIRYRGMLSVAGTGQSPGNGHQLWLFLYMDTNGRYWTGDSPDMAGGMRFTGTSWTAKIYVGGAAPGDLFTLYLVELSPHAIEVLEASTTEQDTGFPNLQFAEGVKIVDSVEMVGM